MGRGGRRHRRGENRFARPGERSNIDVEQGPKPPFCPFMTSGVPVAANALQGTGAMAVRIQAANLPCMRDQCMFWDSGDEPAQCGFISLLEETLFEDVPDDEVPD